MRARPTTAPAVGAIGIFFGDIGTSPLYAIKETLGGHCPLPVDRVQRRGLKPLLKRGRH